MSDVPTAKTAPQCGHAADPFAGGEKQCILCGRCLQVCPLFKATGREELSPRGKFFLARTVSEQMAGGASGRGDKGLALSPGTAADLAGLCLSCGRCEKVCPQGMCAPHLVGELRAAYPGWENWLWKQWIGHAGALWPAAGTAARLLPGGKSRFGQMVRKLKGMLGTSVRPWLAVERFDACGQGRKAVLFPGCVGTHARSDWTDKSLALLGGVGFEVPEMPGWGCCGSTLGHAGLPDAERALQLANLAAWRAAGRPLVAVFCATCLCGLRAYADALPLGDQGWENAMEREQWKDGIRTLAGLLGETSFRAQGQAPPGVMFHMPCHGGGPGGAGRDLALVGRALGDAGQGGLLRTGKGNECCGMGGVLQLGAPGLSSRVAANCWDAYGAQPGEVMLTACSGCVTQLAATAPDGVAAGHWLDMLCL